MAERGPTLVVAAAIVRDNEILLARRYQPELPEAHLKWELPGGKVELKESPHDALIREIREELEAEIRIVRVLPHVQSNIYHSPKGILHSVVLAFESVIVRGAPKPRAADTAVRKIVWANRKELSRYSLLPGTQEFVQCLDEPDRASYSARNVYIRLERRRPSGQITHYREFQTIYDLWKNFNIIERHGDLVKGSMHYEVYTNIEGPALIKKLRERIRSLANRGYLIVRSDNPAFIASQI